MTHLASVLILLLKIHIIKLCVGISWKTHKLYAIVFATCYLDDTADASKKAFETVQRSGEFTVEASKKADEIKTATLKQADQIKSLFVSEIIPPQLASLSIVNFVSVSLLLRCTDLIPELRGHSFLSQYLLPFLLRKVHLFVSSFGRVGSDNTSG
ncbi:hypothetical protein ACFX2A_024601 [Malus domestica]